MTVITAAPPPAGHNHPPSPIVDADDPVDFALLCDPLLLREQLEADAQKLITRRRELLNGAARFEETHKVIDTEDLQARVADFVDQLKKYLKAAETERVRVGAPFLAATKTVQNFFNAFLKTELDEAVKRLEGLMSAYTTKKVERERAILAERERIATEAAAAALLEAERTRSDEAVDRARIATETAAAATKAAAAPVKDLGRTRGALGGVAVARELWEFEITNPSEVPVQYLMIDTTAIRKAVAAGTRTIPGVRIFDSIKSSGR